MGSSASGNQPAVGQATKPGLGREAEVGPMTVIALAVVVEPEPMVVANGLSSQRRWPTGLFAAPASSRYCETRPAEVSDG